jgi:glycosyltransferase involved in cell wall biosynthesis
LNSYVEYIGIDCIALPQNFSGAGNFMYYLATAILKSSRNIQIAIFCKPAHSALFRRYLKDGDKIVEISLKNRLHRLAFMEYSLRNLLIRENINLFHATHYICPPEDNNYSISNSFHDMGFYLYPQNYSLIKRLYFKNRIPVFIKRTNYMFMVSTTTRNDIRAILSIENKDQTVIYPGTDHLLNEAENPNISIRYKEPYILAVNTFEKRKNIAFIIELFNNLKQKLQIKHKLVLIGHPANGFGEVKLARQKSKYEDDIHIFASLPKGELIYFYNKCDFFVNASAYEGFGFTPFEAINFNVPTFLYKNRVIDEIIGDNPYILPHFDIGEWIDVIKEAIDSRFEHKIDPARIHHLTWQNTANKYIEFFEKQLETPGIRLEAS